MRVRRMGELTWSRFHDLPSGRTANDCYFELKLDLPIGDPTMDSIANSRNFKKILDDMDYMDRVGVEVLQVNSKVATTSSVSYELDPQNPISEKDIVDRLTEKQDERPVYDHETMMDDLTIFGELKGLMLLAQLPKRLLESLTRLGYETEIMTIPESWDAKESDRKRTVLIGLLEAEPIENTDRFMRAIAQKLSRGCNQK